MDVAFFFRFVQDLHRLVVSDVVSHAGLAAVVREIADADAPVLFDIAGALTADPLLFAAGADPDADLAFIFFQPVGEMLDVKRFALRGDRLLDGDDVHADAGASGRDHLSDARQRKIGHAFEEIRDLRGDRRDFRTHRHDLRAARHEHIQYPAFFMIRVLSVKVFKVPFHKTRLAQGFEHGLQMPGIVAAQLLKLRECLGFALAHFQGEIETVIGDLFAVPALRVLQAAVDAPVFRRSGRYFLSAEQDCRAVRDDLAQFEDLLITGHFCHKTVPPFQKVISA